MLGSVKELQTGKYEHCGNGALHYLHSIACPCMYLRLWCLVRKKVAYRDGGKKRQYMGRSSKVTFQWLSCAGPQSGNTDTYLWHLHFRTLLGKISQSRMLIKKIESICYKQWMYKAKLYPSFLLSFSNMQIRYINRLQLVKYRDRGVNSILRNQRRKKAFRTSLQLFLL